MLGFSIALSGPPANLAKISLDATDRPNRNDQPQGLVWPVLPKLLVFTTLLPCKDIWLKKLVVAGILIAAGRVMGERWYSDLADGVARQVIFVAYAMVVSGHLPLVMPLLLIATLSETLVMANSVLVGCKGRGVGAWGPHLQGKGLL